MEAYSCWVEEQTLWNLVGHWGNKVEDLVHCKESLQATKN